MAKAAIQTKNVQRSSQLIDAAYGLVQGAFGDGHMQSDEGWIEWNKPEVQKAAMDAAKAFLATIRPPLSR